MSIDTNAPKPAPLNTARPWLIRKRSSAEIQRCPDLQTLRQWIADKRVGREDEISRSEKKWRRLGSIVEFESLFFSVEADLAQRRKAQGGAGASRSGSAAAEGSLSDAQRARAETPPALGVAAGASPSQVGQVRVTPAGAAGSGDSLSPMRLPPTTNKPAPAPAAAKTPARTEPPKAAPGMAGSVQAALRASQPAGKNAASEPGTKAPETPPAPAARSGAAPAPKSEARPPQKTEAKPPATTPVATVPPSSGRSTEPAAATRSGQPPRAGTTPGSGPAAERKSPARADSKVEVSSLDESMSSGTQTAVFKRPDAPEKPATPKRDPLEEAILKNDPVPKHLKDGDDADKTVKLAASSRSTDMTERVEPSGSGRVFWIASIGLGAVAAFALYQYSQSNPTQTRTNPENTPGIQAPANPSANTDPDKSGPGGDNPQPAQNTDTPPAGITKPGTPEAAPAATGPGTPAATNPTGTAKPAPGSEPAAPTATATAKPQPTAPPAPAPGEKPGTAEKPAGSGETPKPAPAATPGATSAPASPGAAATAPATAKPAQPPTAPAAPAATPGTSPGAAPAVVKPKIDGADIPKTFDEQMSLAQRLIERNKYEDAQKLYEYMLTIASSVPAIHVGLGTCAYERGHLDEALKRFQDALQRAPNYSHAIFGLAKTYRAKGDTAQALVYYKQYVEKYPKRAESAVARDFISKAEGTGEPAAKPQE